MYADTMNSLVTINGRHQESDICMPNNHPICNQRWPPPRIYDMDTEIRSYNETMQPTMLEDYDEKNQEE